MRVRGVCDCNACGQCCTAPCQNSYTTAVSRTGAPSVPRNMGIRLIPILPSSSKEFRPARCTSKLHVV